MLGGNLCASSWLTQAKQVLHEAEAPLPVAHVLAEYSLQFKDNPLRERWLATNAGKSYKDKWVHTPAFTCYFNSGRQTNLDFCSEEFLNCQGDNKYHKLNGKAVISRENF